MSISEAADKASNGDRKVHPAGSWQQAAGLFSAIANMLSSDLTTHGMDRQDRADLIQKLDELESTLRNGSSEDNDSLKVALAKLEAELRAWRGMPSESEPSGQQAVAETGGQRSPEAEDTAPEANVIGSNKARPSPAGPLLEGAGTLEPAWGGTGPEVIGEGNLDRGGNAGAGAKTIPNHGESMDFVEQFGRLARDVQESAAQFGSTKAHLPLIERREAPN